MRSKNVGLLSLDPSEIKECGIVFKAWILVRSKNVRLYLKLGS